jgi:phosphoribosylanthranilate isomerase
MTQPTATEQRTRIKICGLTRPQDVTTAVKLGVDALGFVFYPKSKRCLDPLEAGSLVQNVPVFVSTVALFVEPSADLVNQVIGAMRPTYLQFHGDESAEECERFDWPYIKAFRVGGPGLESAQAVAQACARYSKAQAWLFDSYTPAYGGSGHGFDRDLLALVPKDVPMILSGGLTIQNIETLVPQVKPWAVDVSSGVETAPGMKADQLMSDFVAAVRRGDQLSTPL